MTSTSRRAVRLASALIAAGLALTATPAAHADSAGSAGPRVLTDAQADQLEKRLQGDSFAGEQQITPQSTSNSSPSSQSPQGTDGTSADGTLSLEASSDLETYRGQADTTQLAGGHGDYLTVHSAGTVTRLTDDGTTVWKRDNASLYVDWQVRPTRPWQVEPYPARITMGYNAVAPAADFSDRGYTTGDLTGDGVADVVFTADVGNSPYRPFTVPGSTLSTGTFVTVLDGRTGKTVWTRIFADAQQVTLVGDTLVVGDQPSTNLNAPKDARATLQGFRFSYADGKLTPTDTWTYETGQRDGRWGSTRALGGGLLAVSWNRRKTATAASEGHTLVLDTADGTVKWQSDGALYSRQLAYDSARKRLVAVEQADYRDGVQYQLAAYDSATGARTTLDTRVNALALGLQVGNLKGDSKPEYAVSEDTLDEYLWVNASTVRALDGGDASELWSRTVKRDESNSKDGDSALGLQIVDGQVLASYITMQDKDAAANPVGTRYGRLAAIDGRDGEVSWEKQGGPVASPIYAQPYRVDNEWRVRTVDNEQNIRSYRLNGGRQASLTPLQGDLTSAVAVDVNGDRKKDVVTGGQSHGLWAYDGPSMVAGKPEVLWKTTLPGAVHGEIVQADTDGDGKRDELVVAADSATVIVDAHTGRVLRTIDGKGQFVRSVAVADVDHDGADEVLVPTDAVRAYQGNGKQLWSYAPEGAGVVFSDLAVAEGRVFASYGTVGAIDAATSVVNGMALDGKSGKVLWTADPKWTGDPDTRIYAAELHHGVFADPGIPYADGHAVVHSWIVREDNFWTTLIEFRDARTGKVVHTATGGGAWTTGNWFTGEEGAVLASTAALRTYAGGDKEYSMYTLPTLHQAEFGTGPGGRRLIVGGTEAAIYLWDPAVLTAGHNYPDHLARINKYAVQNTVVADLDGDGVDEIIGLGADQTGYDRTIELAGGRYLLQSDQLHGLTVDSISRS
ncbi:FG-GAP-like repeat-containing protein [Streptomyces sp. NPDC002346]